MVIHNLDTRVVWPSLKDKLQENGTPKGKIGDILNNVWYIFCCKNFAEWEHREARMEKLAIAAS
jgi:hypothetical protein